MWWRVSQPIEWVLRLDLEAVLCSIYMLLAIGFLIQTAYAMWLHAIDPCLDYDEDYCLGQLHFFFGSERAEGIAALAVVALSFGLFLVWASFQIRFVLPSMLRRSRAFVAGCGLHGLVAEVMGRIRRIALVLFRDDETGPDARRVQREFQKQRVQRVTSMIHRNIGYFLFFLLLINYYGFLDKLRRPEIEIWGDASSFRKLHWMFFFGTGGVPMLVTAIATLMIDIFPSRVTPRLIDMANVMMSSVWAWKLAVSYTDVYPFHKHWLTVTHLIQIFYFGNARLSVVLNSLIFAVDITNVFIRPRMPGASTQEWVLYRDLLVFVGMSTMAWALEKYQLSAARLLVQTQKADQTTAMVGQVLSRACDAVPQLDAELCLSEPCADLGALLLREDRIPVGSQFLDFIRPEDQGLFRQSLAGPASTLAPTPTQGGAARPCEPGADEGKVGAFAGLCHLRMQMANNEQMKVSVFYSCVPDPDGLPSYVLGIREDREEGAAPVAVLQEPSGPVAGRLPPLAALPEAQASAVPDDRSSSAWSSISDGEGAEGGDLSVWIDAKSYDLTVVTCSPSFALLGGAGRPCTNLKDWMSESHVQDMYYSVDMQDRSCIKVVLHPPGQGKYTCKAKLGPDGAVPPAPVAEGTEPVLFIFKIIQTRTEPQKSNRDATKELMEKARKKHAGGAVQQAVGAANSVRQRPDQPLAALSAESEPSAPRSGPTLGLLGPTQPDSDSAVVSVVAI